MNEKNSIFKIASTFVIFFIILSFCGSIFFLFFNISLFPIMLCATVGMLFVYLILTQSSSSLDPQLLKVTRNNDSSILVQYEKYSYCIQNIDSLTELPERDDSQQVVPTNIRAALMNYLNEERKLLSDPNSNHLITLQEARQYIHTLQLCNADVRNKKGEEIKSRTTLVVILLIASLVGLFLFSSERDSFFYEIFLILTFISIAALVINFSTKRKLKNKPLVSGVLSVYDRKEKIGYKGAHFFYVRVWDGKYIINQWLSANQDVYKSPQVMIQYTEDINPYVQLEPVSETKEEII